MSNVAAARKHGRSLEQVLHNSALPTFAGTPFAGTRDGDVAFVYREVQPALLEAYGAALINHVAFDRTSCNSTYGGTCQFGSASGPGGSAGVGLLWRNVQVVGEVSTGHQVDETTTATYVTNFATRDTHVTVLAGMRIAPANTISIDVLGGLAWKAANAADHVWQSVNRIHNGSRCDSGDHEKNPRDRPGSHHPSGRGPAHGATVRAGVGFSFTLVRWSS